MKICKEFDFSQNVCLSVVFIKVREINEFLAAAER